MSIAQPLLILHRLLLKDASLWSMLETVMIVQAAQGQILVDVLTELQALCADLASSKCSPPPPFDDES